MPGSNDDTTLDFDHLDRERLAQRRSEKWNTFEADILPAWVAEMDYPLAPPVRDAIQSFVGGDDMGYPIALNATGLRESFAKRMRARFDWSIEPGRIEILSDVMQGLYIALEACSRAGDPVIVQTPVYPPFVRAVHESGRTLVENPLIEASDPSSGATPWHMDLDGLAEGLAAGARVVLFCNPQNPTGRVFRRDELEAFARLVVSHGAVVISDEIHADLVFGGARHIPLASVSPEMAEHTISLNSASKSFNIPGLRCAVAHFGTESLQTRFNERFPRRVRGGVGLLGLYATMAAWEHGQPWLDAVLAHLEGNRDYVIGELPRRFPELRCVSPEGTYMAWADASGLELVDAPAIHFRENGRVALTAGRAFGAPWKRWIRINFATSRPLLEEVMDRMSSALGRTR